MALLVDRLAPLTPHALHLGANTLGPRLVIGHPCTFLPRRVVSHVDRVAAREIRDPVADVVLMEPDDLASCHYEPL